jgi:hypothetical protein
MTLASWLKLEIVLLLLALEPFERSNQPLVIGRLLCRRLRAWEPLFNQCIDLFFAEVAQFQTGASPDVDFHRTMLSRTRAGRLLRTAIAAATALFAGGRAALLCFIGAVFSANKRAGGLERIAALIRSARDNVRVRLAVLVLMHDDNARGFADQRFRVEIAQLGLVQIATKPATQKFAEVRLLVQRRRKILGPNREARFVLALLSISNTTLNTSRSPNSLCCLRSGVTSTQTARPVNSGHGSKFSDCLIFIGITFPFSFRGLLIYAGRLGRHASVRRSIGFCAKRIALDRKVPAKKFKKCFGTHRDQPRRMIAPMRHDPRLATAVTDRLHACVGQIQVLHSLNFEMDPTELVADDVRAIFAAAELLSAPRVKTMLAQQRGKLALTDFSFLSAVHIGSKCRFVSFSTIGSKPRFVFCPCG